MSNLNKIFLIIIITGFIFLKIFIVHAYNNADLSGTWDLKTSYSSGTITFDGNGDITDGSWINADGQATTYTLGTYTLNADGTLTATVIPDVSEQFDVEGAMNQSKDIIATVHSEVYEGNEDRSLAILTKADGTYSNADLSGTWNLKTNYSSGTVTFDGNGDINGGSWIDADGQTTTCTGGTYTLNVDGTLTATIIPADVSEQFDVEGVMNQSKDIIAAVNTEVYEGNDDRGFAILTKAGGTYSNADLSGAWDLKTNYSSGTVTFDGNGAIIGGSWVNADGQATTYTLGTYTLNADGTLTATVIPDVSEQFDVEGVMNQSKDIIAIVNTEVYEGNEDRAFAILIKNYELSQTVGDTGGKVEIIDDSSDIFEVFCEIPALALTSGDTIITIDKVVNPPILQSGIQLVGNAIDFGPHGLQFNSSVTICLPYPYDIDPNALNAYTYNFLSSEWNEAQISSVDKVEKHVLIETSHFSIYALGQAVSNNGGDTVNSGDTGSGGCFIKELFY